MVLGLDTFQQGNMTSRSQREQRWDTKDTIAQSLLPPEGDRTDRRDTEAALRRGVVRTEPVHQTKQQDAFDADIPEANRTKTRVHPEKASAPAQNPYGQSLLRNTDAAQKLVRGEELPESLQGEIERLGAPADARSYFDRAQADARAATETKGDRGEAVAARAPTSLTMRATHTVADASVESRVRAFAQPEAPAATPSNQAMPTRSPPLIVPEWRRDETIEKLPPTNANYLIYPITHKGVPLSVVVPDLDDKDADTREVLGPAFDAFQHEYMFDARAGDAASERFC